ncbi:hypothetical protein [Methylobacterium sp. Leaf88]|uniref:hypothetical protein n=1 Tax=Methylobacterium sp. Leaf88 TaxID=1736244 RepID=UPI000A776C05|nr:hypothetical protein [Methylobacterium sp. Leaf88]
MITLRAVSLRGMRTLFAVMSFAGGFALATNAQALPLVAPVHGDPQTAITPVQYWGGHGDWGHHRRHHEDRGYGHQRRHFGWGHRDHGWDHYRGWEGRRHHHHGRGRYDY